MDTAAAKKEPHAMTWITIARQSQAGAEWVATDPTQPIELYKQKYDQGMGAMAQRRKRGSYGFELLYEENKKPHKIRQDHMRWNSTSSSPAYYNSNRASKKRTWGGTIKGRGKYHD